MSDRDDTSRRRALDDHLDEALVELRESADSLLARASDEDRALVERQLRYMAELAVRRISAGQAARERIDRDLAIAGASLRDVAAKHEIRASRELQAFLTKVLNRAMSAGLSALSAV